MGNAFKKRKQSTSHDEKSKPHNESGLTSISAATYMPSASGESAYSEESSDISSESNESACPNVSNSLTDDEIEDILKTGDLSRMHEIDAWIAGTIKKGEWNKVSRRVAIAFGRCCFNSDGASLHALIHLPHFHLIACDIVSALDPLDLPDDKLFLEKLRDALLPHVHPEHEMGLRWWLQFGIEVQYPVSVIEFWDELWSKSMSNHSNDKQTINMIYSDYLEEQERGVTIISLIKSVIHIGISRHIRVLLDVINDPSHNDAFGTYSKSHLLEWALCSNLPMNNIHILRHIDIESAASVKAWNDGRRFFTSQIYADMWYMLPAYSKSISETVVPRILEQMDICSRNCRTDGKAKAISWLLCKICKSLEEEDPGATWEPILVGSAAECTQALFIDEFDYVLFTNSGIYNDDIRDSLKTILYKTTGMHLPRLALESMKLNNRGSYPCLYITCVDEHLRNTHISIDLVPAHQLTEPVTLPHHNFLTVPRKQLPDDGDARQGSDTNLVDHENKSSSSTKNIPRVFNEIEHDETVFSQVENSLIKALPSHIIEGYRLAKAFRITHVIRSIIQKLIELGVTVDIRKIIRTYHLKTCVFYLTEHYEYDDSDIEGNNRWTWAIDTFMKLREFVMLGDVKEFFATERYIFKGLVNRNLPECDHDEDDFTAPLPRFLCCRRRKARLLMVEHILRVLCDSKSKFDVKY